MLILGHTITLIGAIVSCTAHKTYVLIIGMSIMGAGSACQFQAVPIMAEMFRKKYRAIVLGLLVNSPYPFVTCSTLIVHKLVRVTTWRWVYYLNIILTSIAFFLIFVFYHPPPRPDELSWKPKQVFRVMRRIDYLGIVLIYLFLALLTLALVWAGFGRYGWATAAVLVPICMSLPILLGLAAWEKYGAQRMGAKHHLFPPIMFSNHRRFTLVQIVGAFSSMAVAAIDSAWPNQITGIYNTDSTTTGLYALPTGFGLSTGALLCGFLLRRIGHTNIQLVVICLLLGLSVALMATLTPNGITPGLVYSGFVEFFSGWILVLLYVMIQFSFGDDIIGTTTGILHVATNMGPAFALAFYLTIIRSMVTQDLPKYVAKAVLPLGLPITSLRPLLEAIASQQEAALAKVPGISGPIILAAIQASRHAQSHSYRIVYFVAMTCCIIAAILAAFTVDVTPQMNNEVTIDLARDGGSLRTLVTSRKEEELRDEPNLKGNGGESYPA